MRQHANRLTVLTLAAVSVVFVGCDGPQTQRDKEVQENINKAQQALATKGPATQAANQAIAQSLAFHEAAAKVQGASLASSIKARMFVGHDYYNLAIGMLGQLDDIESAATLSLRQIQSGIKAIERNNVQLKVLAAADPAEVVKAMEKAKADQAAQSAASAELLKKTQELATAKEAQIKETQSKLATATDEMNQLFQKAELARGQESVDLHNKAVAARQTVQNTSHLLAQQQLDLTRLQQTIAEATAAKQTTDANAAITQKSIDQVAASWAETQKAIAARTDDNKTIMESQIVPQAKNYAAAMAEAAKVRQEIEQRLDKAIAAYQAAGKDAAALLRDFMTFKQDPNNAQNPSMPARKALADSHDPQWYSMLSAKAMLARATLGLNLTQILDRQNQIVENELKPVLLEAKLMVPAELVPSNLTSQLSETKKQTETLLTESDGIFGLSTESALPALAKEAGLLRVASQYALYVQKDFKSAPNLQTAQAALREFVKTGQPIPRLPAELESRTVTRTGPVGQGSSAPVPPRAPEKTPGGAAPAPGTPATQPAPAIPSGAAPGVGMPDVSGLTNLIPGMKKKDPNARPTPQSPAPAPAPAPDDNK